MGVIWLKRQKIIILLFSIICLALTIFLGIYIEKQDCMNNIKVVFDYAETEKPLSLFNCDNKYYAFLPSNADVEGIRIESSSGHRVKIDDILLSGENSDYKFELEKEYKIDIINFFGIEIASETLVLLRSENIPSISIILTDGTIGDINKDKSISKTGYLQTVYSDNTVDYQGQFNKIHGRGNSSWAEEKKSYTIEFAEEVSLLNMEQSTHWLLISNSYDESSLRNKLVYDTAKHYGVNYAIDSQYVDLYVGDQYMGLYLLCEKIQVSENRINIADLQKSTQQVNMEKLSSFPEFQDDINGIKRKGLLIPNNPSDITGGYLLQIDYHEGTIDEEKSFFSTESTPVIVSHPQDATKEQIIYISDYFFDIEKRIQSGDLSKIDINSFVRQVIISECFANSDNCSIFLIKDSDNVSDKLLCGPVWDYDLSMGNCWDNSDANPYTNYYTNSDFFEMLCSNIEFYELLKTTYAEKYYEDLNHFAFQKLREYKSLIEKSFLMNKIRWKHVERLDTVANRSQKRFDTLDEHIKRIEEFLEKRNEFLGNIWIENANYYFVVFKDENGFKKKYSVKSGETFNENLLTYHPQNNNSFIGWFDENGAKYISGEIITQNKIYTARFSANESPTSDSTKNSDQNKEKTAILFLKDIAKQLLNIDFEIWCFAFIFITVVVIVVKDLLTSKLFRRKKNERK